MINGPNPLNAAVDEMMKVLSDFHGQESMRPLRGQLRSKSLKIRVALSVSAVMTKFRLGRYVLFLVILIFYADNWFRREGGEIYIVSLTENNNRALQRIMRFLPGQASINGKRPGGMQIARCLLEGWGVLCDQDRWRAGQGGGHDAFVTLHQIIGVACVLLFAQDWRAQRPKLVIAANDHSPPAVALFSLARALSVRCCYVQHASVTSSFPALAYDLSILYNQLSVDTYGEAARRHPRSAPEDAAICLWPPELVPPRPIRPVTSPATVGVVLSFFPEVKQVRALLARLAAHRNVVRIVVRQHPRCRLAGSSAFAGPKVVLSDREQDLSRFSEGVDLCIVGNSSAALNLLQAGCPCVYLPGGDRAEFDYYGFVREGILPQFAWGMLDDLPAVSEHFGISWKAKMARFDPLIDAGISGLEQRIIQEFHRLLGGN